MLFCFSLRFHFRSLIHSQYFSSFFFSSVSESIFYPVLTFYTHNSTATVFRKLLIIHLSQSRHNLFSPSSSHFLPHTQCVKNVVGEVDFGCVVSSRIAIIMQYQYTSQIHLLIRHMYTSRGVESPVALLAS